MPARCACWLPSSRLNRIRFESCSFSCTAFSLSLSLLLSLSLSLSLSIARSLAPLSLSTTAALYPGTGKVQSTWRTSRSPLSVWSALGTSLAPLARLTVTSGLPPWPRKTRGRQRCSTALRTTTAPAPAARLSVLVASLSLCSAVRCGAVLCAVVLGCRAPAQSLQAHFHLTMRNGR